MARRIVHVFIEGRVQGVWFRGWTVREAEALGLDGWVRNRADGRVEAVFAGADDAVEEMIGRCRRGPPAARVAAVHVEEGAAAPGAGFEQRPTI